MNSATQREIYKTIDPETNEIITHSRSEERRNDMLNKLGTSEITIKNDLQELERFYPQEVLNSFKNESEDIVDKISSLQGNIFSEEGKLEEIRRQIKELGAAKVAKVTELERSYQEKKAALIRSLDEKIHAEEGLTSEDVAKITLRNEELQGEIRGLLHTINTTRDLEYEFKQLAKTAEHDKGLQRFLLKNYYLFMDKAQEIGTNDMDKGRAVHNIKISIDELQAGSLSDREQALRFFRSELEKKTISAAGVKRSIEHHIQFLLREFS